MIPIYKPYLPQYCLTMAHEALQSGWVSSRGRYPAMAAEKLAELFGVRHALLVNSGSSATHLLSCALQAKRPDLRLVHLPNNAYVAAWNAFLRDSYHVLRPVDADLNTWNADFSKIRCRDSDELAFAVVHNLGNVINVPALRRRFPRAVFVENCCESFLGRYEGVCAGTDSLACSLSFYGNKTVTSGEGGAVLTNHSEMFEHLQDIATQGAGDQAYVHAVSGYNYRMTNVQAALLLGQLQILGEILERKAVVFERYRRALASCEVIRLQSASEGTESAEWILGVRILGSPGYMAAEEYFRERLIEVRPMFPPIGAHGHLRKYRRFRDRNARLLHRECLLLPSYPELEASQVDKIAEAVKSFARDHAVVSGAGQAAEEAPLVEQ